MPCQLPEGVGACCCNRHAAALWQRCIQLIPFDIIGCDHRHLVVTQQVSCQYRHCDMCSHYVAKAGCGRLCCFCGSW